MSWKTVKSEEVLGNRHVRVRKDMVELPDGAVIEDFYTVTIPDAAMVCALTADGELLLKTEYRYAIGADVIECPAGMFDEGEKDPLVVAKRELLEETGYTSEAWTYLGETLESTSKLTNRMHLFLAKDCVKVAEQDLDDNEHLDLLKVSFETAVDMVMDGRINANSTAHLVLKVDRMNRQ
jgi:8-oxo-dGTP pyrophosphatase MutT (NUDIX family)